MNAIVNFVEGKIINAIDENVDKSKVVLGDNEAIYELPNNLVPLYSIAHNYNLEYDKANFKILDISIIETHEDWLKKQPITPQPTLEDYILDLDFRLSKKELGL